MIGGRKMSKKEYNDEFKKQIVSLFTNGKHVSEISKEKILK
jgi:transposase-like protein